PEHTDGHTVGTRTKERGAAGAHKQIVPDNASETFHSNRTVVVPLEHETLDDVSHACVVGDASPLDINAVHEAPYRAVLDDDELPALHQHPVGLCAGAGISGELAAVQIE